MNSVYRSILPYINIFVKKAEEATVVEQDFDVAVQEAPASSVNRTFNLDALREFTDDAMLNSYIEYTLKPVGSGKDSGIGSGRKVYEMPDGNLVLKFAYNRSGIYQNYEEARIANRNPNFASVFELGPGAKWIVSEKIKPFGSREEFQIRTGVPAILLQTEGSNFFRNLDNERLQYAKVRYDLDDDAVEFLKNIAGIHRSFGTIIGDLRDYRHWGVSSDGLVKLYDYGLDSRGFQNMYQSDGLLKEPDYPEDAETVGRFEEFMAPEMQKKPGARGVG